MVRTTGKSVSQSPSQNEGDPGSGLYPESMPRDANIISLILKQMDVYEYDTRVIPQFLDFPTNTCRRFTRMPKMYAEHAGRTEIMVDDVKLAIQAKLNISFTAPPPREVSLYDRSSFWLTKCLEEYISII